MKSSYKISFILAVCLLTTITNQQVCLASQYFNGQRCAPCQTNCVCSQQNTCSSCMSGYTFDATFKKCLACPTATSATNVGCAQCCYQIVSTTFICSSCPAFSNTYLLGGQCLRIQGCLNANENGLCTSCGAGYFLRDGTCLPCDASCSTCTDNTFCTACNSNYYNATNGNFANCIACPAGCSACSSNTVCSACLPGYRLQGTCIACSQSNCNQCSSTACTNCNAGYALIGGVCYACSSLAQGGTAGCTSCSVAGGTISCSKCADGYYLTLSNACATCHSRFANSVLCTLNKPLQCSNDFVANLANRYYLVSNQCVSNSKKCKVMKNTQGDCSSCYFQPGAYYQLLNNVCVQCVQSGCKTFSSTCQCIACQNGYQFVNQQCVACQNLNCYVCQSDVRSCQVCSPYYGLISSACIQCTQATCINCDGDSTKCQTCITGYYNSEGTCYRCQASCQSCTSSTVCTSCNNGHYLLSNGRCKSLPSNCAQVDSTGECVKCNYGYIVNSGACSPCSASLYNLQQCQKFCPSYYAELTFQVLVSASLVFITILVYIGFI